MPHGLAPQLMAWQRRMNGLPGLAGASGDPSNGLPVQVEMLINGVWTDITSYVMVRDDQGNITITHGIRDEGNATEQATAALPVKNQDGRFTPRNPMGVWYGLIGRNQPIRVSVPDGLGGKSYRIWGEVPKFPPSWDPTGTDVWVDITAAGLLQRLAQGPAPARSVIYNAIASPASSNLVAYWPMEDPTGSTQLASGIPAGSPMTWTGTANLASYSSLAATDPLPDLTAATLSGGVGAYSDPTATQVRFLAYIPTAGLANYKVLCAFDQVDYSVGAAQFWELYYSTTDAPNSLVLRTCADDGTNLGALLPHTLDVRGRLLYVSIELQESGTSITRAIRLRDVATGRVYSVSDTETLTSLTRVTQVQFGPASRSVVSPGTAFLPGVAVGHCTIETAITAIDALGVRLNPIGESAGRRIQRLCGEQGIPFEWVGDLDDTVAMGAQGKSNPLALMQECVTADGGLLYESQTALGLGYRTRASLYNQDVALTLNYTAANLSEVPTPVEDDRYLANKVVVSVGGVTATYEDTTSALGTAPPPAGVGVYGANADSPLALNLASSDTGTLLDQAAWRVHLGTVNEARYPQISVFLQHPSITPDMRRAILALRIGDRVQVINPPSFLGTDSIDQLILGREETVNAFQHRITFTCQPASPYSYLAYLDTNARIDTDGSQLLSALGTADTSIDVVPTSDISMLWTLDPTDLPFDVRAAGEVMRVTAVTPKIADTFGRTVSNGWGAADTGQTWSTAGGAAADYSVAGGQGQHSLTSINVSRYCVTASPYADVDVRVEAASSVLATGGPHYVHLVARYLDTNNNLLARLAFNTDQTLTLTLEKRVGGVQTDLASVTVPGTHAANTFFGLRFQVQGATLRARAWPLTGAEPGAWHATAVDASLTDPGSVGVRSILSSLNTNVLPVTVFYDNLRLVNVQTFTVTRSMNGVIKSHAAGEDIRLAYPTYLAL
ncbi:hypothetical protein AB0M11_26660 [Streptomyces sp. NPDC051987]|uniref:hypothetical protein n=1 Tax=Streptomyces sp. NPDC051987 TaxID=3155808 RepID=UPI0034428AD3